MKALSNLKAKFQEDYQSTFEFDKYNIEENLKKEIIENEAIIFRNFRTMSESTYKVCKALYETSMTLKADKSFQAWYENIGLGKDKVSELLKRYDLYIKFPKSFQYITSLSNQAVKILTAEKLDYKILYDTVELEIVKVDDIKMFIQARNNPEDEIIDIEEKIEYKVNPMIQKETKKCVNYKGFEKLKKNISKMDPKQIIQTEKEIESLESYIKILKKSLENRSKSFDNIGALQIEFENKYYLTPEESTLLFDIKTILDYSNIKNAAILSKKITDTYKKNKTNKNNPNKDIDSLVNEIRNMLLRLEDKNSNENFVQNINLNKILDEQTSLKERIDIYNHWISYLDTI